MTLSCTHELGLPRYARRCRALGQDRHARLTLELGCPRRSLQCLEPLTTGPQHHLIVVVVGSMQCSSVSEETNCREQVRSP